MHRMHAEPLEKPARSIQNIPLGTVDVKGWIDLDGSIRLRAIME